MLNTTWGSFVIYVNAYYAVQEAYDSARRDWKRPAEGLDVFCRDANPFLWDMEGSAEEGIYEEFARTFEERFELGTCTAAEGLAFAREWLARLEGDRYGTALVASLDATADEQAWSQACELVERQLAARAARLERTPQDVPMLEPLEDALELVGQTPVDEGPALEAAETFPGNEATGTRMPSPEDVEAVIALLSKGDEAFAQALRQRLVQGDEA